MTQKNAPREAPLPPAPPVSVKGRGGDLRIVVSPGTPEDVEKSLREQLARRAGAFFSGAAVSLEFADGLLDLALAARLADVIEAADMRLTAVTADQPEKKVSRASTSNVPPHVADDAARIVTTTLRGGQRVIHDGAVVVIGDVNPGASVVAGGSVVVWGRLRGTVEAGLNDDGGESMVCALDLAPTQLRIGACIARAPEEPGRTPVPEVARQRNGRIVVDTWT